MSQKYYPIIDGLRALAVMLVIYFHAFPEKLSGGFIGVDIFFVISGFLITKNIHTDLKNNNFNFINFYSRRIKRILPSLLLVLFSSFIFGWYFLTFDEFKQLGKHIAGATTFISNITLWYESGYFDNSGETKPLLHLWSLAVEEQFYIFWPIMLWLAWKKNLNLIFVTLTALIASFTLNIFAIGVDQAGTFYLPITRGWELLAGAVLAMLIDSTQIKSGAVANSIATAGFAMIVMGAILLNKSTSFPGWWALLPVSGCIFIIVSGNKSVVNKILLSNKLMVWLGIISYPLYLWHWTLLSFARIAEARTLDAHIKYKAILLAILLAWISYKFFEKPIRVGKKIPENFKLWILISLMALIGFLGFLTSKHEGKIYGKREGFQNIYKGEIGHLEFHKYVSQNFYECTPKNIAQKADRWEGYVRCQQSKINQPIDIALLGNSHAEHLFIGFAEGLPQKNVVYYANTGLPSGANKSYEEVFQHIHQSPTIKHIVISMDWIGLTNLKQAEVEILEIADQLTAKGKTVYVADGVPAFSFDPIRCKGIRFPYTETMCTEPKKANQYEEMLKRISIKSPNIQLLQTMKYFCHEKECSMIQGGELLYRDNNHLNINGSQYLGKKIIGENVEFFK
jgi:peptidoglycan/LPS O-acetylase OafA/YrhL